MNNISIDHLTKVINHLHWELLSRQDEIDELRAQLARKQLQINQTNAHYKGMIRNILRKQNKQTV